MISLKRSTTGDDEISNENGATRVFVVRRRGEQSASASGRFDTNEETVLQWRRSTMKIQGKYPPEEITETEKGDFSRHSEISQLYSTGAVRSSFFPHTRSSTAGSGGVVTILYLFRLKVARTMLRTDETEATNAT
ncbi:hypothetical protein EUGRSUZ_K00168 [Eucalyptus grandis]|uniref:Uncharacterized protein n=2 Tax=Eucalyptus grandis TaxID=71139 RepID=A0ACC3IQC5_EUCGR|nr:hypothetical protein EUGRSUZ_K00168 [Eucalyptus grandis]